MKFKNENKSVDNTLTVNPEGMPAYNYPSFEKLYIKLSNTKVQGNFYQTENEEVDSIIDITKECLAKDTLFTLQTIVYTRCVSEGMRTASHIALATCVSVLSGTKHAPLLKMALGLWNKKRGVGGAIYRLDDMHQVIFAFQQLFGKQKANGNKITMTNAMKHAFKSNLEKASWFEILKWRKIVDVINLTHPVDANCQVIPEKGFTAIKALKEGLKVEISTTRDVSNRVAQELSNSDLTESEISIERAKAELAELSERLTKATQPLLDTIRNVRKFLQNATLVGDSSIVSKIVDYINNADFKKNLIFPFDVKLASDMVNVDDNISQRFKNQVIIALNNAFDKAVETLQSDLKVLVAVDVSSSMTSLSTLNGKRNSYSVLDYAALLAAVLAKKCNANLGVWSERYANFNYNPLDAYTTIAKNIVKSCYGGGTRYSEAFQDGYDFIIILSDGVCSENDTMRMYNSFKQRNPNTKVVAWNVSSHVTTPLKQNGNVYIANGQSFTTLGTVAKILASKTGMDKEIAEAIRAIKFE